MSPDKGGDENLVSRLTGPTVATQTPFYDDILLSYPHAFDDNSLASGSWVSSCQSDAGFGSYSLVKLYINNIKFVRCNLILLIYVALAA